MGSFGPYLASSSPVMTMGVNDGMTSQITGVLPQQMLAAQKLPRTDRLEVRTRSSHYPHKLSSSFPIVGWCFRDENDMIQESEKLGRFDNAFSYDDLI